MSEKKAKDATLDASPAVAIQPLPASVPRFVEANIPEVGGPVRLYQLTPEQRLAFRHRLLAMGIRSADAVHVPKENEPERQRHRRHLVKLVQACARAAEGRPRLVAPGDTGFRLLWLIPDADLEALARVVVELNRLFG